MRGKGRRLLGFFAFGAVAFALAKAAQAGSYDDFNQGLEARNRGDADAEIAAFTRALADGDLLPSLRPVALFDRGLAYELRQNHTEAIDDFSAIIKQKPDDLSAHEARANSYADGGNYAAALPDCEAITSLEHGSSFVQRWCGRTAFLAQKYDEASDYFRRALKVDDGSTRAPYDLLWLGLTALREGKTAGSAMSDSVGMAADGGWPSPLVRFFLGESSESDMRAAAAIGDAPDRRNKDCEVGFYLGEWKLAYRDTTEAKSLLQNAVATCPGSYIELQPAKAELVKLD